MTTLSTGTAIATISFALSRGLTTEEIQEATGYSCFELLKPDTRVSEDIMPNILAVLAEKFPGEPFALEMARAAPFSYFGGLADGAQFAKDLRTSIQLFVKNSSVIADQLEIEFIEEPTTARFISRHPMDHIDDGRSHEVGLGLIARLFTEFLGVASCVERVTFTHEPNSDIKSYTDYFGVPVEFGSTEMALYIKPEKLASKIKHANVNLFNYVTTHFSVVQKQIKIFNEPREMTSLRKSAAENVLAGVFNATGVAAGANMSVRTAQRLASENGTSIQELVDQFRECRAKELLADNNNDIGAIAFMLGYSEDRAFRRAFRRWTGQSPSDFRSSQT